MLKYIHQIQARNVYSLGDVHGRGREMAGFIQSLSEKAQASGEEKPVFVQLGDLCDCFALPGDNQGNILALEELRCCIKERIHCVPGLAQALSEERRFVDWRLYPDSLREGSVHGICSAQDLINSNEISVLSALYEASMSFETMDCLTALQQKDPDHFIVIFGNHDADLLRGHSDYGRQQKYIFLGLLGFSPNEVIEQMLHGTPSVILRHPWMEWLNERPHLARSADTLYMHGGPTGQLAQTLADSGREGFDAWLDDLEAARHDGWEHPAFKEHHSFLSLDGADNDWVFHPETILSFCQAANVQFLAVGHSPFLDFPKGPLIDLKNAQQWRHLFHTPARLQPDGRLIKHDTNLKRSGEFWACHHQTGSSEWNAISVDLLEIPLPVRKPCLFIT